MEMCATFCKLRAHCSWCKCRSCTLCDDVANGSTHNTSTFINDRPDGAIRDEEVNRPNTVDSSAAAAWKQIGRQLIEAFEHVTIISLPSANARRQHMKTLLTSRFQLHSHEFSFSDAFDCNSSLPATWERSPLLTDQSARAMRAAAPKGALWYVNNEMCTDSRGPPGCLHADFSECLSGGGCRYKYICYTLSVASALHSFLHASNHSRTLLLEDDVCPTYALSHAGPLLTHVAHDAAWDAIKIGHCDPCDNGLSLDSGFAACIPLHSTLPTSDRRPQRNAIRTTLARTYCGHALGLTKRGARALLRLSVPVSTVFDDILMQLGGGFGSASQQNALQFAGLQSEGDLRSLHVEASLFGQVSKHSRVDYGSAVSEVARRKLGQRWEKHNYVCVAGVSQARSNGKLNWAPGPGLHGSTTQKQ